MEEVQSSMETVVHDLKPARRAYSLFALSATAIYVIAFVAQVVVMMVPMILEMLIPWEGWTQLQQSTTWIWLVSFLPLYLVGVPLGLLICVFLPAKAPEKKSMSVGRMVMLFCISYLFMYAGNLIGTVLSLLLSGGSAENAVAELAMDNNPLKFIFMVIVAPLVEEFVFRKILIDRVGRFGEKVAVVASALTFAMFHMNLFQFFYAFGVGLILAYMYVRTGRLRYPVILHMVINFLGSVVAAWILGLVDLEALDRLPTMGQEEMVAVLMEMLPGLMVYMLYSMMLMGVVVTGLVLLIVRCRRTQWEPAPQQLPAGMHCRAMLLNTGMIILTVMCLIMTVAMLFI